MEQFSAPFSRHDFGENFLWGVTISAFQNEGACDADGKGKSIWDEFTAKKGKIKDGTNALVTVDFYNRYREDIQLVKKMGFQVFRFSISWPRILPMGTGSVNPAGIAFYHRVIDACLEAGLIPYVTLYHWDLPHALEQKGGWCHRGVIFAFEEYVRICVQEYGDKVKNWVVMNEPFGFTSLGYMLGVHAPGKFGISYFLPAVHHVLLAQAAGAKVIRATVKGANIGTALSSSYIYPYTQQEGDIQAARKADALFNRLFIEPVLGMGYPVDDFPLLRRIERRYALWRDWDQLAFDFDFIGVQNYFPLVVRKNAFMPVVGISEVKPKFRKVPITALGWEISGEGMYAILKQFGAYKGIKKLMVTESGAAFADIMSGGAIDDQDRIGYFREYLAGVLKAKREGVPVEGYFAWTLTDNFEWAEGYRARFGLVHVDLDTQERTLKSSGHWFRELLTM
ncbi:GH1 family beta-glucosidase [Chitinophaga agri]|uniref:Beta-glucosidase n=1 Tax=Chitinophaga agri TaxID=2703787 RepID=A0A6B9ZKY9_9BACT|nr:GH1 family beta-glucosidase [Chitinophaga agri]QHS62646.1 beta-glucosidase [Chitinophaga agri]